MLRSEHHDSADAAQTAEQPIVVDAGMHRWYWFLALLSERSLS
jgi:hypothetical protein